MTETMTILARAAADVATGYGTAPSMAVLRDGLLQTRLVLLGTLMAAVSSNCREAADKAGLHEAFRTMSAMQESHPELIDELLSYPNTGGWLSRVIRRVTDCDNDSTDEPPLWAELGYLGWLAAVGSLTTVPSGCMPLVVRRSIVHLPGIGTAQFDAVPRDGYCVLAWTGSELKFTADTRTIHVPSHDSESVPGWLPLRLLQTGGHEPTVVVLDDLDPFRDIQEHSDGIPEELACPRLTAAQAETWQNIFEQGWRLLEREGPQYLPPMRAALHALAPLTALPHQPRSSVTSFSAPGCIFTTAPKAPSHMAEILIHEMQHTKFTLLSDQVLMCEADATCRFYAPWRDDPRPVYGMLHGIYSFFGITDFWRAHRHTADLSTIQAHVDFERWRIQTLQAMPQVVESGLLTIAGQKLLADLAEGMTAWSAEDVPEAARLFAVDAAAGHHTFWRVRNLRPAADGIAELADGRAARTAPIAVPAAALTEQDTIPVRYRTLLPSTYFRLRDAYDRRPPGTDTIFLGEDLAHAAATHLREIEDDPLRPQPWAGLVITLPKLRPEVDFSALRDHAEVVAHLYHTLRARGDDFDVVELIAWLSESPHR